jgi:hypothetical protein
MHQRLDPSLAVAGRSVRLYLADGGPHGLIIAGMGNWSGKVLGAACGRGRPAEPFRMRQDGSLRAPRG